MRAFWDGMPTRHGSCVRIRVPRNLRALPGFAGEINTSVLQYGTLEVVAGSETIIPLRDIKCPCCECKGIKCLLPHAGHSHTVEALAMARRIEEQLFEALKIANWWRSPVTRPYPDVAKS